jgi:hypothetical protein
MTAIDANAEARAYKVGGLFTRKPFLLRLFVNDIDTGLSWRLSKKELAGQQQMIVDNAALILNQAGLMEKVFAEVAGTVPADTPEAPEPVLVGAGSGAPVPDHWPTKFSKGVMPQEGQRVTLTTSIGHFPKGLIGTVTRIDGWLETIADENQYPVRVALTHGADTVELPLHLHEIEVVR